MYTVATHKSIHGLLIVITDTEILGKVFSEGKRELNVTGKFFEGEEKGKEEVIILLRQGRHLHLTGKNIVELARNLELIDVARILWVDGIPHAQAFCEG